VTLTAADVALPVASYARQLHAAAGHDHHVASPLGAWLLLALCGTASAGEARAAVDTTLGCDSGDAADLAAELLASPHPLVPAAAAAWFRGQLTSGAAARWLAALPPSVPASPMPSQADLDEWARRQTVKLIERFPGAPDPELQLLVATVLATRVSWDTPFGLAPATALGLLSPWAARLSQVLRTPDDHSHQQFVAATAAAGDVAVHTAWASSEMTATPAGDLTLFNSAYGVTVTSVAAAPGVPPGQVLAAAYEIAPAVAARSEVPRRSLFDLPLGDGPLWSVSERRDTVTSPSGREERCTAVLPAWSAHSTLDLTPPGLGFDIAMPALVPDQPWGAAQAAMARYTRVGFEAAAVTSTWGGAGPPEPREGVVRTAELRFGHPYAVVAVAADWSGGGAWNGLPVFSAWVARPEDAGPE
jgi:hypothetical protein